MKNILTASFLTEYTKTISNMYRLGWDERNGGNVSYLLREDEVKEYLDTDACIRTVPLTFVAKELAGKLILITGTGKYFKNVEANPEANVGILKIAADGASAALVWGLNDGGNPTSELPAHLMSHVARLSVDPENRVILHTHPTNLVAMTHVHELETKSFTHTLWEMMSECIVVYPDGVEVLPWMLCGTNTIGEATAEKMKLSRVVVWSLHGIYGAGKTLDEVFGLVETVEKAAQIYMMTAHIGRKNTIKDDELMQLCDLFHLTPREGFLKL